MKSIENYDNLVAECWDCMFELVLNNKYAQNEQNDVEIGPQNLK